MYKGGETSSTQGDLLYELYHKDIIIDYLIEKGFDISSPEIRQDFLRTLIDELEETKGLKKPGYSKED